MACIISFRAINELQRERLHHSRATVFTWNGQTGKYFLQVKSWVFSSLPRHHFDGAWSMAGIFHTREIDLQTDISVVELILRKFPSSPEKPGEPRMRKHSLVPGARKKRRSAWYTLFAHAFNLPGTPGYFWILLCHVTSEFGPNIVNLSG